MKTDNDWQCILSFLRLKLSGKQKEYSDDQNHKIEIQNFNSSC